jgi:hypothetical protein
MCKFQIEQVRLTNHKTTLLSIQSTPSRLQTLAQKDQHLPPQIRALIRLEIEITEEENGFVK